MLLRPRFADIPNRKSEGYYVLGIALNLDLEDVSGGEFAVGEGFRDESDAEVVAHSGQNQVGGGQFHIW